MIDVHFTIDGLNTGNPNLDFKSENPISQFYRVLTDRLNDLNIQLPQNFKERYPKLEFPENVDVKILMVDNNQIFKDYFDDDSAGATLGFFNLTNSKNILGTTNTANEFIVVVEADLKGFDVIYNKFAEKLNATKSEMLSRYLVTLTHELCHALEFIENSGGLTPLAVETLFEQNLFEYDVDSCATGFYHDKYKKEFAGVDYEDDHRIYDIMEDRVEVKGRKLYQKLNVSNEELIAVLNQSNVVNKAKRKFKM